MPVIKTTAHAATTPIPHDPLKHIATPQVSSPPDQNTYEPDLMVRFTYVPGEGLYAGDANHWYEVTARNLPWTLLRSRPKLTQWLTKNPLTVVYGRVIDETLLLTNIYAGQTWVPRDTAQTILPGLVWVH